MKKPIDWDEEYILGLPIGEYDWLEAKGRREIDLTIKTVDENQMKKNLSVSISAFANSGGGQIVLGLQDPSKAKKWAVDDGGIDIRIKKNGTKEWLEDLIPNLVDVPLKKFNVYEIGRISLDSHLAEGRAIYVIDIGDSVDAPHQAIDNKYYARVASKSRPIGHRFVADIMGRRQYPKIELEFTIFMREEKSLDNRENSKRGSLSSGKSTNTDHNPMLKIVARNVGRVHAQYVNCFVKVPIDLVSPVEAAVTRVFNSPSKFKTWYWDNRNEENKNLFVPILPSLGKSWRQKLRSDLLIKMTQDEYKIEWSAFADSAVPSEGTILVRDIPIKYTKLGI